MATMETLFVLLLTLLIVSTMVSSKDDELLETGYAIVQPSPAVPVKAPLPPSVGVEVTPPPPPPPAPAPPVKPPVLAPPVKPPTPPAPLPPPPRNTKGRRPRNTKECYPPCVVRCKLHSRKNVCLRACVTCCDRCKCVPPGQYGNKEKCGKCYVNMTTHGGRPKCP